MAWTYFIVGEISGRDCVTAKKLDGVMGSWGVEVIGRGLLDWKGRSSQRWVSFGL